MGISHDEAKSEEMRSGSYCLSINLSTSFCHFEDKSMIESAAEVREG